MKKKKSGMAEKVDTAKLLLDHQKQLRENDSNYSASHSGNDESTGEGSTEQPNSSKSFGSLSV